MPNPYNRIIKTPAEQRAEQARKKQESDFASSIDQPPPSYFRSGFTDMESYESMQASPISHDDEGGDWLTDYTTIAPPPPIDYSQEGGDFLTDARAEMGWTEPEPQETPWYLDLPHVPGVSQAGAWTRDNIFKPAYDPVLDVLQFIPETAFGTIPGGLREGVGGIFGGEAKDFYSKWYSLGFLGEESVQQSLQDHADLGIKSPLSGYANVLSWFTEQLDPKKGFSNDVIKEIAENPDAAPSDIYRMTIEAHEARPGRQQLLMGLMSPEIVLPVGGMVAKLAKGLKVGGQTTKALVTNSLKLKQTIDPSSMRYRHLEPIGTGQKQVIIVSHSAPEGRRITIQAGELPSEALESAAKIGLDESPIYKILPSDANRIEVARAFSQLGTPVDRVGREALEKWAGKAASAGHTLRPRRANLPEEYIISDLPAFATKGINDVDRMEIIERFWRDMPKEFQGIGDEILPTDAFVTGRKLRSVEPTGLSQYMEREIGLGDALADVSKNAKVGDVLRPYPRGKQYKLISQNPDQWEAVPYPGPQPGVGNAERINRIMEEGVYRPGAWPATGAKALKDRIRLEVSKGFDPTAGADAMEFIDSLPPNLLDFLMVSFRNTIDAKTAARLGELVPGATTAGFYESSPTLLTIIKNVVNRAADPSRTIIHELFHHIEQFIPEEQLLLLRKQWADDIADNGDKVIESANNLLKQGEKRLLTNAEKIKIKESYRYEGGFPEWIAEVMTDKAMRDILQEIPEYRNLLQRVFDALSDIAVSTMNFLLRKGRKDEAEKIYQDILRNKYSERLRYGSVAEWSGGVRRPAARALLDVDKKPVKSDGRTLTGPTVRKINPPALIPDLFGDRDLLHVVDTSTGVDEVVAVMEIRRVGAGEGAEVAAFYPTVEKVGPGTFGPDGIKKIIRQIGDIYPDINNMDFAGKLLREGPEAGAEGFVGTAAESMAQRLWASDISDDAAAAVNAGFPRASSVDAARMADPGLSGQRALAGVSPRPTQTGYHHTLAERINEIRGMEALDPEHRAILGNIVWPIRPGELLYDMADYGSHNILFDKPGLTNTLATWVPGAGKVMGVWNRAQLEQFDPIKAIGHEVELFKDIEKSRVRTAVLAWRATAYPILGFKQIRSKWDMANNRQGVWRAEKVVGYDEKKVLSPSSVHGTIDDILKDMDEVRLGVRVPSQLVNGVEKVPPGKKQQIYFLTEEQESHIKMAQEMMEQSLRRNQEAGVDVIALQTAYWHRMVLKGPKDKNDSALNAALDFVHEHKVSAAGPKKNYQYTRAFDDIDELDKGGFVWETDPAARMLARLDAGIETFAHRKAYDKVLNLKTPEGRAFLTRRERLGTLKEGSKETGLYVTEGPTAIKALNAARILRVEGRKIYKRDPSPTNELAMRRADAQFLTAYRRYRAADARANPNYFEATLNGKINDRSLIDEIYENVHIPQVQHARKSVSGDIQDNRITESMQLFRAMMTNIDLAAMGIQGQTLIYRDPASWFTAVKESVRAIVKEPDAWIKKNREFLDEGQSLGAILRPTEWMFDPTGIASIPTKIPLFGPAFRGFQRSFEWFIIVGQTELYKSVRSSKLLKGVADRDEFIPLQSDEAMQAMIDAGRAIRRELGTENMAILGIRPTQRTIEQLAFFASRFMRANVGLVALALRPTRLGGKTGLRNADSIEAKRALLSMLGGGTAMLVGTHYALTGRAPNVHDPFAPDWFQVPIGKTYYNFMGPLYPYFRAVAQAAQRTKEGDPGKALEIAGRFLNSKAGLLFRSMKITADVMVTGESRTFEGDTIDKSFKGVATAAQEFTVPLSITGVADALSEGRYEATLSEVFGLTGRAHPNAQMDILFQRHINDPKHTLYKERVEDEIPTGGTWYDASPLEKSFMEQEYKSIAEDILRSGRGDYGEASRQFHALDQEYIEKQMALSELLYTPVQGQTTVDGIEFRDRLEAMQKERYAKHDKIVQDFDLFTEPPKIKSQQEQDLYDYHQVFANAKDATGNIMWAKLDEDMGEFEERVGDKRLEYILSQTGLNNSDTVKQLRKDKQALQEVWDWRDNYVRTEFELDMQMEYYRYRELPVTLQRQAHPGIQNLVNDVSQASAMWLMDRDVAGDKTAGFLEQKLVYWGYETSPYTEAGIDELMEINADLGFEDQGTDPRTNRPGLYPEIFGGQGSTANGASMPIEETDTVPQWLQSVRSGR